jgi:glucosamine-6-phosphate deaminase
MWTVSMLQLHRHGMIVCDDDSTLELKVATVRYFRDIEREHLKMPTL